MLAVRLVDGLDTTTATVGQTFHATLDSPLSAEGDAAIPSGYDVEGHVVDVKSAGKFAGQSELTLQLLDRISVGPKYYSISTDQWTKQGSSRGKNTAAKVGAGAESEPLSERLPAAVRVQPSVPPRAVDWRRRSGGYQRTTDQTAFRNRVELHPAGSGQCAAG